MTNFESLLTTEDMMRIFQLSQVTLYRRLRDAKAGRGDFPLPIQTGGVKRCHRWNAEEVRKFLENANEPPQTPPALNFESEKSKRKRDAKMQKRHADAMKKLEKLGVRVPKKEQD